MNDYKYYYSLLRYLKKNISLTYPVCIRRVKLSDGYDGVTYQINDKFHIKISKDLKETQAIDALIHEMAHCLCWKKEKEHGNLWGIAYSKVYRAYLKWLVINHLT